VKTYRFVRQVRWKNVKEGVKGFFRRLGDELVQSMNEMGLLGQRYAPVPAVEILNFTRYLGIMIDAGIPISRGLEILQEQCLHAHLKEAIRLTHRGVVSGGLSLHQSLSLSPEAFGELYVNLVATGEVAGSLGKVLKQLAAYLEASDRLKKKIKGAVTYPAVVAVACVLFFGFFVYFVLPKFVEIFQGLNAPMPLPTRILIAVVHFFHRPKAFLILGALCFAGYFPFIASVRTVFGRARLDYLKLKIPMYGNLHKQVLLSRFSSTFGSLLNCGVPLLQALEVTGKATGNEFFHRVILHSMEEVRLGEQVSTVFGSLRFFPPIFISMARAGEESAELGMMLGKLAAMYETEVTIFLQKFVQLLEPLLVGAIGLVVGFTILAVFLPLYSVLQQFH